MNELVKATAEAAEESIGAAAIEVKSDSAGAAVSVAAKADAWLPFAGGVFTAFPGGGFCMRLDKVIAKAIHELRMRPCADTELFRRMLYTVRLHVGMFGAGRALVGVFDSRTEAWKAGTLRVEFKVELSEREMFESTLALHGLIAYSQLASRLARVDVLTVGPSETWQTAKRKTVFEFTSCKPLTDDFSPEQWALFAGNQAPAVEYERGPKRQRTE
jgi:hypothetical protein